MRDRGATPVAAFPAVAEGAAPVIWRDARPLPPNPRPYPGHVTRVEVGADPTAMLELIGWAFGVDRAAIRLAKAGALDDPAIGMFAASSTPSTASA